MKRILVATDGSEGANRALEYAAKEAKERDAALLIANVIGWAGILDDVFVRATEGQQVWLTELLESTSAEILKNARERALALGVATVQIESRSGKVAEALIEIAKEKSADLIVTGKRGSGEIAGVLLGSISQKLASLSPLPVTVVP
jgi:nucleotide-binding universal stress UspA family protein